MSKSKIFIFTVFMIVQSVQASTVTVRKIKGRQAIIETSAALEVGQTYELQNEQISIDANGIKSQSRKNSLQLGAELQSLTAANVQDNRIFISARYGWNFEYFEIGPTISYQSIDLGAGTDSDFFAGGYFDYNIQKNKNQTMYVWGPTFNLEVGTKQLKSGGSASLMNADLGGFLTWYLSGTSTALRIQGAYHYQKITTPTTDTALTGLMSKAYLVFYF